MSALRPETRRMLALARQGDQPHPGVQRKVERALAAKWLLVGGAAASGTVVTSTAAAALLKPLAVAVGVALGVVSAEYGVARHFDPAPAKAPATAARAPGTPPAPLGHVAVASPGPELAQPAVAAAPSVDAQPVAAPRSAAGLRHERPSQPLVDSGNTLRAETSALRAAQKALRDGDTERALEVLSTEAARHPNGALAPERAAARVLALCQSGKVELARREAREFEALYPTSPLLARVRAACVEQPVAP